MLNKIKSWLANKNRSYADGLELFQKVKRDSKHDKFFSVQNPARESMQFRLLEKSLRDAIALIARNPHLHAQYAQKVASEKKTIGTDPIVIKKSKVIERPVINDNPHVNREELPEHFKALYDENKQLYKEMAEAHVEMKTTNDNDLRKNAASVVSLCEDTIRNNWDAIDKWWNNDRLNPPSPAQKQIIELTPAQIADKIQAARKYLERYSDSQKPDQIKNCDDYKAFLKSVGKEFKPKQAAPKYAPVVKKNKKK